MRASKLPTLKGKISNGYALRRELAMSISDVERYAKRTAIYGANGPALEALLAGATAAITAVKAFPASIAAAPAGPVALSSGTPTQQLTITKTPVSGSGTDVTAAAAGTTYISSDPTKATVSTAGLITRVAVGTTIVRAYNQNKVSNAVTVNVS